MKKHRILLVNIGTVMGGAEVYIERLACLLSDRVEIFALCGNQELARRLRLHGATVCQMPLMHQRKLFRYAKYVIAIPLLMYLSVRYRVFLSHFNGYQTSYLIPLAKLTGNLAIITPHHLPPSWILRHWYGLTVRSADLVVNVSEVVNQQHRIVVPKVETTMIPNWLPETPNPASSWKYERRSRLLFVGRLVDNKGLPVLLNALRSLDSKIELVVAGEGPMRQEYEAAAGNLPVRFLGYAEDLRRLYSEVDALVVPSLGPEGSCLVALEAMAAGLPCILSDLPVYEEIADGGKAALLFRAGDTEDLVRAIGSLYSKPELIAQMRHYAREMIEQRYSEAAVRKRYLSLFGCEPMEQDYSPKVDRV